VALALHHKVIPPTIKVTAPNPAAHFEESPFYLATDARPWVRSALHPRRASVSSFGFGGSNFHVAVEEYTGSARPPRLSRRRLEVIPLGADDDTALRARAHALDTALAVSDATIATIAREAARAFAAGPPGRSGAWAQRAAFVASTTDEARAFLRAILEGRETPGLWHGQGATGKVAFLFPGQGSQHTGMAGALAMEIDAARAALDRADGVDLGAVGTVSISHVMFPPTAFTDDKRAAQERELTATANAQPALGAACLATLRALESLGVSFDMVAGHSFGELVALCAAGAFDEMALVKLARRRGELMAQASSVAGAMAAVVGDARAWLAAALDGLDVVVANENAPDQTVIAGSAADVLEASRRLRAHGLTVKKLAVSTAFHSPLMSAACEPLSAALAAIDIHAPVKPVYANTTAAPHGNPDSIRRELSRQVRDRVRFVDELRAMYAAGARVFVEVGPGQVLTGLVQRTLGTQDTTAIATGGRTSDGLKPFLTALARLCAAGVDVDLARLPETAPSRAAVATKTSVMVSGSNLGKPALAATPAAALPAAAIPATLPARLAASPRSPAPVPPQAGVLMTSSKLPRDRIELGRPATAVPLHHGWLEILREGQRQTADAHVAFQRSLTDAHAAYLHMVEVTQCSLVAALTGHAPPAPPDHNQLRAAPAVVERARAPAPSFEPMHAPVPPLLRTVEKHAHSNGRANGNGRTNGHSDDNGSGNGHAHTPPVAVTRPVVLPSAAIVDVRSLLLDVVAEKTGYPKESLDDSMSLEADLGIDSIKRVEILGALKERLPSAGALDALQLAQLKTLGEIAGALDGKDARRSASSATATAATDAAASLLVTLIDVVAEKTGYPKDALSASMALEGDLGVDSIKRVEILSTLKERVPQLPAVDAVRLAQLQTLGEIASALEGHRPF
jgi:acyl transferase domain-containing protein/acyl carrier protein